MSSGIPGVCTVAKIASGVQEGVAPWIARGTRNIALKVLHMRNWEIRRKTGPARGGELGNKAHDSTFGTVDDINRCY